jgi:asparagine synthase (glutamine-hydrolysing)
LASRIAAIAPGTTAVTLDTGHKAHDVEGARRTAARYGLPIEVHWVDPTTISDAFVRYIRAMDQPTVDGFNTFLLSEFTRSLGFPVLISGLGADEALGGYSYARYVRRQQLLRMAYRLLPGAGREVLTGRVSRRFQRTPENVHRLLTPGTSPVDQFFAWREIFGPDEIKAMTGGRPSYPQSPSGLTDTEVFRQLDRLFYLRSTLLRDSDIFSMASGVEMRVPFVSDAFHSIVATMRSPSKNELAGLFADPYLSARATAPKTGFSLPLDQWSQVVADDRGAASGPSARQSIDRLGINDLVINDLLRHFEKGPYAGLRHWSIAVLRAWLDKQTSQAPPS